MLDQQTGDVDVAPHERFALSLALSLFLSLPLSLRYRAPAKKKAKEVKETDTHESEGAVAWKESEEVLPPVLH